MKNKMHSDKKFVFSVIDFVIIFLAIALTIGIFARYDIVQRLFSKTSLSDAKITFVAEAITADEVEAFAENAKFYVDDELFGTLQSIKTEKALIYRENIDGTLISYEDDTLLDISGTFTCRVLNSEKGFLLGGNRYIAAGSVFVIKSSSVAVSITITSVEEIK